MIVAETFAEARGQSRPAPGPAPAALRPVPVG
jgi:hypothetical protein